MDDIYFNNSSNTLRYIRKNGVEIYDGVYKMNDGKLVKRYYKQKSLDRSDDFCEEKLLDFKDIYIDNIVFTRALIYSSTQNIYATITEYVPGISIDIKSLGDYPIDELLIAIRRLEKTIKEISNLGIRAVDVYRGNIIYDGSKLTLIDTIEYCYSNDTKEKICMDNMLCIMNEIFTSIFYKNNLDSVMKVHKYFSLRCSELEHFNSINNLMTPIETLIKIRKFIEEDFNIKINTFNEGYQLIEDVIIKEDNKHRILTSKKDK